MDQILTHRASELRPETRAAVEAEFGHPLQDNDEVSVRTVPESQIEARRREGVRGLQEHFARMDERTKDIPEDEVEEILIEAIRSVRPGYRERE